MNGADLVRYFEALKSLRQPLEEHKRQCYQYSFPLRGVQFGGALDQSPESIQQQAAAIQASLTDATATDACRILASTLVSGLTPANSRWFAFGAGADASTEVKTWLDQMAGRVHEGIHSSNYDAPGFEAMLDIVISGEAALYTEEGDESDFLFDCWPLSSCWFATTRRGGMVDTAVRHFTLTAQQAVREYGAAKVPEKIRGALTSNPYQRFPFIHFILPKQFDQGAKIKKRDQLQPFASYHVCLSSKAIMREKGYAEFPLAVPRWLKLPDSVYAQGPMSDVLPDVKTLNQIEHLVMSNADWQMSGMWGAVNDGTLNPKTVKIGPRKILFMDSKENFFPLNPPGKVEIGSIEAEKKRSSIRRILMADQLEPLNSEGPARTATEWHYRVNLIRQLLGPMFGRLQAEFLQPLVFRCLGILLRKDLAAGKVPPAPLQNKPLRLQYISPLARAQQLEEVAAMDRFEGGLVALAEARPELLDLYDWDNAERKRGEYLGVPQTLLLDEKKVKEIRKLREDKQAAALNQQAQGAMPAAMAGGGRG